MEEKDVLVPLVSEGIVPRIMIMDDVVPAKKRGRPRNSTKEPAKKHEAISKIDIIDADKPAKKAGDRPVKRDDVSLARLTQQFIVYMQQQKGSLCGWFKFFVVKITKFSGGIEIEAVAAQLCTKKRRIYDIVNILETIKCVEKRGKNTIVWLGMPFSDKTDEALSVEEQDAVSRALREIGATDVDPELLDYKRLMAEIEDLVEKDGAMDKELVKLRDEIYDITANPDNMENLFVTLSDLKNNSVLWGYHNVIVAYQGRGLKYAGNSAPARNSSRLMMEFQEPPKLFKLDCLDDERPEDQFAVVPTNLMDDFNETMEPMLPINTDLMDMDDSFF